METVLKSLKRNILQDQIQKIEYSGDKIHNFCLLVGLQANFHYVF